VASYKINYNDKKFKDVKKEEKNALNESNKIYDGMINSTDKFYQDQINATKDWANTQQQIQNEQTDFAIEKVEQQKDWAHKDYIKEQSGAYADWQKQSNPYGVKAEQMAANGMSNSGYSESSQVRMFNAYQNRVATARESYTRAVVNYDNMIKEARLKNSSALAEIAYQSLMKELELALSGFQYKNELIIQKANKKAEIEDRYYTRYQNVLQQMNTENAFKEQIRQFNVSRSRSGGGGRSRRSGGGGSSSGKIDKTKVTGDISDVPKGYVQEIGMQRSLEGKYNKIQALCKDGKISETQANNLLKHYGI
jgi:hypothetical protein